MGIRSLDIVEIDTGRVVKSFDVTGRSEREIQKIERGMLINLNREDFVVRDSAHAPLETPEPRQ
jgi:hypothetical protein